MYGGYKSTSPWDNPPAKQPENVLGIIRTIKEVAFALRDAKGRMVEGRTRLSDDDLDALHQYFTRDEADDLTDLLLGFSEEFGRIIGLFLGVVSWRDFVEQMKKVDATVKDLETAIDQKNDEMDTTRRRWQDSVRELEAAQATELGLRERVAHLERALVYASAQVGERR